MSLMYEMLNSMQVFVLKPILIEQTFFSKCIPMKQDMQIYTIPHAHQEELHLQ